MCCLSFLQFQQADMNFFEPNKHPITDIVFPATGSDVNLRRKHTNLFKTTIASCILQNNKHKLKTSVLQEHPVKKQQEQEHLEDICSVCSTRYGD